MIGGAITLALGYATAWVGSKKLNRGRVVLPGLIAMMYGVILLCKAFFASFP